MPKRRAGATSATAAPPLKRPRDEGECAQFVPDSEDTEIEVDGRIETRASTPNVPPERLISKYPNEEYTVGWVCALAVELKAAKGMLDETHGEPQAHPSGDHNAYILGRIRDFNVAIACLPLDEYGTPSAANVVGAMWNTFSNLKVGLFVGIGGGIPVFSDDTTRDIRLGDVVVGMRVVDYETGKRLHGGRHQNTGHQNRPPRILRSALNQLRAEYQEETATISGYIDKIITGNPGYATFSRPEHRTDDLCSSCLHGESCDGGKSVKLSLFRPPRPDKKPRVHYGTIASGNTLSRDREFRETIREEHDAMCFDMEAAGVMNSFNGLVIRGISDYADCHKNDKWQGYAAVSAAAFAKLLLGYVPRHMAYTGPRAAHDQRRMEPNPADRSEKDLAILNWLSEETLEPQHIDHLNRLVPDTGNWFLNSDLFQELLNGDTACLFCPGMPGAGKTMISTLAIDYLREGYRDDPGVAVCFLYFDYRVSRNDPSQLLTIVLRQLVEQNLVLPEAIRSLFSTHNRKNSKPSLKDLWAALESALLDWQAVFLVVDAIDECPNDIRDEFLQQLLDLEAKTQLRTMITSRPHPDITDLMRKNGTAFLEISARDEDVQKYIDGRLRKSEGLRQQSQQLRDKIRKKVTQAADGMQVQYTFLLAQLDLDRLSDMRIPRDIEDVLESLPTGSEAYAEAFSQAMHRIGGQAKASQELAKRALSWITYARRPLRTKELQHALALRPGDTEFHESGKPEIGAILSLCVGLVVLDEGRGIVRLVHYTTQQYFEEFWEQWFPDAQSIIGSTCIQYLSLDAFESGPCEKFRERLEKYRLYAYAARNWGFHVQKASLQRNDEVIQFLKSGKKVDASTQVLAMPFGSLGHGATSCHLAAYVDLEEAIDELLGRGCDVNATDDKGATALAWAASGGSAKAVRRLLLEYHIDVNVNSRNYLCGTPLHWAVFSGHTHVVKQLTADHRVSVNAKDREGMTPLALACWFGDADTVAVLLADGRVNPDCRNRDEVSPLQVATGRGHASVVQLLLRTERVDVNARKDYGSKDPGDWWMRLDHLDMLLAFARLAGRHTHRVRGNPYRPDRTPLSLAAGNGYTEVMEVLLATGSVKMDEPDTFGNSALSYAAKEGQREAVQLLLQHGSYPGQRNSCGQTPLFLAAEGGHEDVVEVLLQDPSTDAFLPDRFGRSPLLMAAQARNVPIIHALLARCEKSPYPRDDEQDLITMVTHDELQGVIRSLPSCVLGLDRKTILFWAAEQGHIEVVDLLLNICHGMQSSLKCGGILSIAAKAGHTEMLRSLLLNKDLLMINSCEIGMALEEAAKEGHYGVAEFLLRHRTGYPIPRNLGTCLHNAARNGHHRIVELFLEDGWDANSRDFLERSPLSRAALNGHAKVVDILLRNGANPSARDKDGRTPLDYAQRERHEEVVRLLTAHR
ncbi:ankyrin repeat-containing domain protein [Aspergillus lucknowensis]|uniref:Ankyrin repeat-containing domain protein n=1 Tax=Aspergillus lucknowensis TaxID=176173 RepID=A0ABR4LD64_9EURO